jgi:hypothetical protein
MAVTHCNSILHTSAILVFISEMNLNSFDITFGRVALTFLRRFSVCEYFNPYLIFCVRGSAVRLKGN